MVFIFNTKISPKKRIDISLLDCFGLNHTSNIKLVAKLGLNNVHKSLFNVNFPKLNLDLYLPELVKRNLRQFVGLTLKNFIFMRLRRMKRLKNFKSFRHSLFLPVRGQRTRKNAQTQKVRRGTRKKLPIPKKKR